MRALPRQKPATAWVTSVLRSRIIANADATVWFASSRVTVSAADSMSPEVPNYGKRGTGPLLHAGMVICIEPMINMGSKNVTIDSNGWTVRTRDHKWSAHYEHAVAIREEGNEILSTFDYVKEVLGDRFI